MKMSASGSCILRGKSLRKGSVEVRGAECTGSNTGLGASF